MSDNTRSMPEVVFDPYRVLQSIWSSINAKTCFQLFAYLFTVITPGNEKNTGIEPKKDFIQGYRSYLAAQAI